MQKKKVIVFANTLLPSSQTFIKEQAINLTGWEAIFVGERPDPNGLRLDNFEEKFLYLGRYSALEKFTYQLFRWFSMPSPFALKRLKALNADLIHAHFGTSATTIYPYAKALNIPLVVTLHGYDITIEREWWEAQNENIRLKSYPKKLKKISNQRNVSFIAVSRAIKEKAIKLGIPKDKINTCYIGVNTNIFKPSDPTIEKRRKRIIFVGRLVEKKGADYLIKAFAETQKKIPDSELVIIGYGELEEQLKNLCRTLNINVSFLEKLNSQQIITELNKAMIFCLPSITAKNGDSEGLPISILEAQSVGLPVITTIHSGNIEAIRDNHSGFLSPERDFLSLSKHMVNILSNKKLLIELSINARKNTIEKFDITSGTRNLEKIYNKCLKAAK